MTPLRPELVGGLQPLRWPVPAAGQSRLAVHETAGLGPHARRRHLTDWRCAVAADLQSQGFEQVAAVALLK